VYHGRMTVFRATVAVAASALLLVAGTALAGERWVPVVAQVTGADGSYWNTELWIANLGGSVGTYAVTFLPSAQNNGRLLVDEPAAESLGPHETVHLKDVVPPGSSGALRVLLSDNLVVRCRLYNTRGGSSVGQFVPALSNAELVPSGGQATLVPLVRSAQFRTNVGLFNPGANPIKVRARVFDEHGREVGQTDYALEPGSQVQVNDFLLAFKVERADAHQVALSAESAFAAYGSIVDARSGAPTLVLPVVR
jgi:hypothetical protein